MHLQLVLLNTPNLPKSACIDHNSIACCFSRIFERCEVIVTHYFMKVKCVFFLSYSDSICCMLRVYSGGVKSCFDKKKIVMEQKTHVISCKILMVERKDRKC